MPTISPLTTAFLIILAFALIIAVIAFVRDRARFRGYQQLTREALRLARTLKGEVFRDGHDLVAYGSWHDFPVQIRFSHAENTPGLDIRMGAPAGFTLSVMPARSAEVPGRVRVRTPDERFNARFAIRSGHPTHAQLFLAGRTVMASLQKLCRSSHNFLLVSPGQIEFGELGAPDIQSAQNAFEYLEVLGQLAESLRAMPGAQSIKVEKLSRPRAIGLRVALAVGVVVCVSALVMALRPVTTSTSQEGTQPAVASVNAADAEHIPGIANWHAATSEELDPAAIAWLRDNRRSAESRIQGSFCAGDPAMTDTAHVLVGRDGMRRLVVVCNNAAVYDTKYPYIGVALRVPKDAIASIAWSVKPTEAPDGDAVLITRAPDDPASGLVLFTRGRRIITGVPVNYQSLKLD